MRLQECDDTSQVKALTYANKRHAWWVFTHDLIVGSTSGGSLVIIASEKQNGQSAYVAKFLMFWTLLKAKMPKSGLVCD